MSFQACFFLWTGIILQPVLISFYWQKSALLLLVSWYIWYLIFVIFVLTECRFATLDYRIQWTWEPLYELLLILALISWLSVRRIGKFYIMTVHYNLGKWKVVHNCVMSLGYVCVLVVGRLNWRKVILNNNAIVNFGECFSSRTGTY